LVTKKESLQHQFEVFCDSDAEMGTTIALCTNFETKKNSEETCKNRNAKTGMQECAYRIV